MKRIIHSEKFSPKDDGVTHQKKMNAFVAQLHAAIRQARLANSELQLSTVERG